MSKENVCKCSFCGGLNKTSLNSLSIKKIGKIEDEITFSAQSESTAGKAEKKINVCVICLNRLYTSYCNDIEIGIDDKGKRHKMTSFEEFYETLKKSSSLQDCIYKLYEENEEVLKRKIEEKEAILLQEEQKRQFEQSYYNGRENAPETEYENVLPFRMKSDRPKPDGASEEVKKKANLLDPKNIYQNLIKKVAGQDEQCRQLSVAFSKFIASIANGSQKPLVLLAGESGAGKTHLSKTLAWATSLNESLYVVNASDFTVDGYQGDSIKSIISGIAKVQKSSAPEAIILIDEFDKLLLEKDMSIKKGALNSILSIIQDDFLTHVVSKQNGDEKEGTKRINLRKIFFILAGSFDSGRLHDATTKKLGLNQMNEKIDKAHINLKPVDEKYLIDHLKLGREIVGRITTIINLEKMGSHSLLEVLKKENGPLKNYMSHFASFGCTTYFSPEFLKEVADKAFAIGTGTRGLDKVLSKCLDSHLFNASDYKDKTLYFRKLDDVELIENKALQNLVSTHQ